MGVSFSCPFAEQDDVEAAALDSVTVKSISFGDDDECRTPKRSVNFNDGTLEPTILKSMGSGKMVVEKSVSFKGMQLERMISLNRSCVSKEDYTKGIGFELENAEIARELSVLDPSNPKHEAAIKLQKVYKSFRTRRKLADCAVLVEQSWLVFPQKTFRLKKLLVLCDLIMFVVLVLFLTQVETFGFR